MRNAFVQELVKAASQNKNIFLLTGDLGFSVLEPFIESFPKRFINVGVAEQNMAGVAAGLAMSGKIVFIYSIANFPTLRCLEQIRNDICYHDANVKIISVGSGFSYGTLGYTHYGVEDISIMRSLPKIRVISPADPIETKLAIIDAISNSGPYYIRLGKAGEGKIHTSLEFSNNLPGMIPLISNKNNVSVLVTGTISSFVFEKIKQDKLNYDLWSVPYIKPVDEASLVFISNYSESLITVEEHQLAGGFGSMILETLHQLKALKKIKKIPDVRRIGVEDPLINVGTQEYMRSKIDFSCF